SRSPGVGGGLVGGSGVGGAPAAVQATASGGRMPPSTSDSKKSPVEPPRELVVVRILAKPEAIERRVFDQLLVENNIRVEAPSSQLESGAVNRAAVNQSTKQLGLSIGNEKSAQGNTDVVLVEAPRRVIASCMQELKNDTANFVGITVERPNNPRAKST